MIREYYNQKMEGLPKHVDVFLSHIEDLQEYKALAALKGQRKAQPEIKSSYKTFINAYFNEENQRNMYETLEQSFKESFKNHI